MRGSPSQPVETFYFSNQPNRLDQFLVNNNMGADQAAVRARTDIVESSGSRECTDPGDRAAVRI